MPRSQGPTAGSSRRPFRGSADGFGGSWDLFFFVGVEALWVGFKGTPTGKNIQLFFVGLANSETKPNVYQLLGNRVVKQDHGLQEWLAIGFLDWWFGDLNPWFL